MLFLTEAQVREALPMAECVGLMRTVFARLAGGEAINQPRRRLILPTRSALHYMAGSDGRYFGAKIYSTNPGHGAHFLFLLYRAEDAALLAILEANALGQIRTGAASGLATSLLARPGSHTLALIGSGFQAQTQLEAMLAIAPIERVGVWSRSREKREAFARQASERHGIQVEAAPTAEAAVRGADIVVTATNAAEPVIESAWVAPGTHINAMGSNQARRRELPADLVARASLIAVDSIEQSRMESGDLLLAFEEQDWQRVADLQSVVAGKCGRQNPDEITLFKSNGLAVEDVIAAGWVYEHCV
jgi:alanine dehydrogenase